ncbi:MAG: DUF4345 family protein, partial [Actinomycetota bacterium]
MTARSYSSTMNVSDRSHYEPELYLPRRRAWQGVFLVLNLIPLVSASLALAVGIDRFVDADGVDVALDSTYRYFGGIYLGVALLGLWTIVQIERRASALVFVTAAIFLGGIGRLISIADHGAPSIVTWFVLIIELGAVVLALLGLCGACTLHIDGQAQRSCVLPVAAVAGKAVTTIEGLGSPQEMHPLQKRWAELGVPQCGYCQSGQIMSAAALLSKGFLSGHHRKS